MDFRATTDELTYCLRIFGSQDLQRSLRCAGRLRFVPANRATFAAENSVGVGWVW